MRPVVAILILISLPVCASMADIYRSVDAQGHVQYSDTPSPGAQLVSTSDSRALASSSGSDASRTPSLASHGEQINQDLAQQAAARAVEKDTSDVRSKQCKQAQQIYQQSIEARRLYKVGSDGERQYLTDDEADQQRVNNRLAMETACAGASESAATSSAGTNSNSTPAAQ